MAAREVSRAPPDSAGCAAVRPEKNYFCGWGISERKKNFELRIRKDKNCTGKKSFSIGFFSGAGKVSSSAMAAREVSRAPPDSAGCAPVRREKKFFLRMEFPSAKKFRATGSEKKLPSRSGGKNIFFGWNSGAPNKNFFDPHSTKVHRPG